MSHANQNDAWSDYWSNETHSKSGCIVGDRQDAVNKLIKQTWLQQIEEALKVKVPVEMLELACGAGYLSNLLMENFADAFLSFTAVDYARINNSSFDPRVCVRSNTSIESFLEQDSSPDIIVSNFGFEYSDVEQTLPMAINRLKLGGRVLLNCHSTQSEFFQDSTAIIASYNDWISKLPLVSFLEKVNASDDKVSMLKGYFVDLAKIDQANGFGIGKMELMETLLPMFKAHLNSPVPFDDVNKYLDSMAMYINRMKHQLEAANGTERILSGLANTTLPVKLNKVVELDVQGKTVSKFIVIEKSE